MRNLDGPDQRDIARSDVLVPNAISLPVIAVVAVVVFVLRNLLGPDISLLEKGAGSKVTSMNFKVFFATCLANVSSEIVSLGWVCFCIEICSFHSRCL